MVAAADRAVCASSDEHCITCGDEGIAMRVLECDGDTAVCADQRSERHEVAVDLVGPVASGDAVLVHAGIAIARIEGAA